MDQLQSLNTSMSQLRNRIRDLEHEVHRIEDRFNVSEYINSGETFPVVIANTTFMVSKELIQPILDVSFIQDQLFLDDLQKRLTKVLEEL